MEGVGWLGNLIKFDALSLRTSALCSSRECFLRCGSRLPIPKSHFTFREGQSPFREVDLRRGKSFRVREVSLPDQENLSETPESLFAAQGSLFVAPKCLFCGAGSRSVARNDYPWRGTTIRGADRLSGARIDYPRGGMTSRRPERLPGRRKDYLRLGMT